MSSKTAPPLRASGTARWSACASVICSFCRYLAQVKTSTRTNVTVIPPRVMGAVRGPQKERMGVGVYFPLFLFFVTKNRREYAIYYLSADL